MNAFASGHSDRSSASPIAPPAASYGLVLFICLVFIASITVSSVFFSRSSRQIEVIGPYGGRHMRDNPHRRRNLIIASVFLAVALVCFIVILVRIAAQ